MCGIFGVLDRRRQGHGAAWTDTELAAFDGARDAMAHRGPDGAGTWSAPGILLGHRRLAILDLSDSATQPMRHAGGSLLTFNGEIYNYLELRQDLAAVGVSVASSGDTEVLLAALATWGPEQTLRRVRGMYAFAWYDPQSRDLWLARDPIGKKPLYVADDGEQLVFSSTLESILLWRRAQGARALAIDPVAVEHFLACGYISAPRTIFAGVEKLQAHQWRRIGPKGTTTGRFQPVPFADGAGARLGPATLDGLHEKFDQAIERRLRSDVPVATFLSGGLDSSLVTAAAARHHGDRLVAYTVLTGHGNDDELAIARGVAAHVGAEHRLLEFDALKLDRFDELVRHWGEPFGDSSALPSFLIAEAAGREHRVILTGDGGDEVQGGYRPAQLFALRRLLHDRLRLPQLPLTAAPRPRRRRHLGAIRFRLRRLLTTGVQAVGMSVEASQCLAPIFTPSARHALAGRGWREELQGHFNAMPTSDELDRALALDFSVYLAEDLMVKVDVACMAHAVEARAPLLDLDFTDACWGIRPFDRVRPWQRKRVVRALAERFLPDELLIKRKQGFSIPVERLMESAEIRQEVSQAALAGHPLLDGVLDGAGLEAELQRQWREGLEPGVFTWRLRWLQRWAAWASSVQG